MSVQENTQDLSFDELSKIEDNILAGKGNAYSVPSKIPDAPPPPPDDSDKVRYQKTDRAPTQKHVLITDIMTLEAKLYEEDKRLSYKSLARKTVAELSIHLATLLNNNIGVPASVIASISSVPQSTVSQSVAPVAPDPNFITLSTGERVYVGPAETVETQPLQSAPWTDQAIVKMLLMLNRNLAYCSEQLSITYNNYLGSDLKGWTEQLDRHERELEGLINDIYMKNKVILKDLVTPERVYMFLMLQTASTQFLTNAKVEFENNVKDDIKKKSQNSNQQQCATSGSQ